MEVLPLHLSLNTAVPSRLLRLCEVGNSAVFVDENAMYPHETISVLLKPLITLFSSWGPVRTYELQRFQTCPQTQTIFPSFAQLLLFTEEVDKAYINSDATRRTEGQPLIVNFIYIVFHYTLSLQWFNHSKLHNRK